MAATKTWLIFGGFMRFLHEFLLFENAMTSEDIMAASLNILGGQGILKRQNFVQKLCKTVENRPRFRSILNEFLFF